MFAVVGNGLPAKAGAQYGKAFFDEFAAVVHAGPEYGIFPWREPAAHADVQSPVRQQVQRGDALGYVHRVVQRQWNNGMAEADILRALG